MAKKKKPIRGSNPPKKGAKARGDTDGTNAQEKAYKQVLAPQIQQERSGRVHQLKVAYQRGRLALKIKSRNGQGRFGPKNDDRISQDLDVKRLTLQQSIKFSERITTPVLKELCAMETPPSWRMMAQWVRIKDESKRDGVLKSIIKGDLGPAGFEDKLRVMLGLGPKRPKRTTKGPATFEKIRSEAIVMVDHLGWISQAGKEISGLEGVAAKREAKGKIREAAKALKDMQKRLSAAIKECEQLV